MKDGTWLNSIIKAMVELGGKARYEDLYQQVARVRKKEGLPLNDSYKSTIRGTVEAYSSDSEVWKKRPGPDVFKKLGTGFWGLKNSDKHIQNTENLSLIERIQAEYRTGIYNRFEQEADALYKDFYSKFAPEKLIKLQGEDLLDTIFLGKNNKSMCYYLEHDPQYREIFGSIRGGTAAKYGLYYSKEFETWVTGNWKTEGNHLSLNDAILLGTSIRDAIVHACEVIESLKPFSVSLAYEELSRKLADIENLSDNQWIRKYFHMIYPDYFPTWYGLELIDKVVSLCELKSSHSLYGKLGEIVRFAHKCHVPNVVFPKIINELFNLEKNEEDLLRYFVESCLQVRERLQNGNRSSSGLTVRHGNYSDLIKYKTSFGQGSLAFVPWMSFCGFGQETSKGIYPVVLFDARSTDTDNIEFCYGLSVTEQPDIEWNEKFVRGLKHSTMPNYTTSFCKKSYKILSMDDFKLYKKDMVECLKAIIKDYETQFLNQTEQKWEKYMVIKGSKKTTENHLNTILYGAPGTGKTYNAVIKALEIITGKRYNLPSDMTEREETYSKYVKEFNNYKQKGQIEFVTFHQSLGYEDFVEGIKPIMDNETSDLKYKVEPGIFKKIVMRAREQTYSATIDNIDFSKTRIFKMSLGQGIDNPVFDYCMGNNVIANGYGGEVDFTGVKNKQDISARLGSEKPYDFNVEAMTRFILWMRPGDIVLIANGKSSIAAIAQIEGNYEYKVDTDIEYKHFRKVRWLYRGDIPVGAVYSRNLSMQSIYAFFNKNKYGTPEYNTNINTDYINELICGKDEDNNNKKYVLIIDEINRGNISKIFGELITLLEPSKRIRSKEALEATLPYSQEPFGVPDNLYIIGTMNTSDRSIATVDIALRRRFEFMPMRPETNLIAQDVGGIKLRSIVEKINRKIEVLLDEDHMIGHSYFLKLSSVSEVRDVWFKKIIPLINEYFYGDWEKINLILGNDFVNGISIDDMPEDMRSYCAGEMFYRFASIQDNLNDSEFVNRLNKLV